MKKIILLSIFIILVSSPAWATNEIDNNPSTEDIIIINSKWINQSMIQLKLGK